MAGKAAAVLESEREKVKKEEASAAKAESNAQEAKKKAQVMAKKVEAAEDDREAEAIEESAEEKKVKEAVAEAELAKANEAKYKALEKKAHDESNEFRKKAASFDTEAQKVAEEQTVAKAAITAEAEEENQVEAAKAQVAKVMKDMKAQKANDQKVHEEDKRIQDEMKAVQEHVLERLQRSQSVCISLMLLGSMGFMMANFYLVNHRDDDIKCTSWKVISATISIFSAVLLFQAVNGMLEYYILEGTDIWFQLVVDMLHMLGWFLMMQYCLAFLSGAVGGHWENERLRTLQHVEEDKKINSLAGNLKRALSMKRHAEQLELNTECWATLLGHITGFASINAWGTLQQALPRSILVCGVVPFISLLGIRSLFIQSDALRTRVSESDGEVDKQEMLWDEMVEETEDDVLSLAVSFLLVQEIRFIIFGVLPNSEGEDPEGFDHGLLKNFELLMAGFLLAGIYFAQGLYTSFRKSSMAKPTHEAPAEGHAIEDEHHEHHEDSEEESEEGDRTNNWAAWCRDIMAMTMSWCLHFSVENWMKDQLPDEAEAVLAVLCALAVTGLGLGLIMLLDHAADYKVANKELDKVIDNSIRALITALGILIGFSWERSFDSAVGGLAKDVSGVSPPVMKLLLAILLAGMVIPAWKWYILSAVKQHEAEAEKKKYAQRLEAMPHKTHPPLGHGNKFWEAVKAYQKKCRGADAPFLEEGQVEFLPYHSTARELHEPLMVGKIKTAPEPKEPERPLNTKLKEAADLLRARGAQAGEIRVLKEEIEDYKAQCEEMDEKLRQVQASAAGHNDVLRKIEEERDGLQREAEASGLQVKELSQIVATQREAERNYQTQAKEIQREVERLAQRNQDLEGQINEGNLRLAEEQKRTDEADKQVACLEGKLAEEKLRADNLSVKVEEQLTNVQSSAATAVDAEVRITREMQKNEDLQDALQNGQRQINKLQVELEELRASIQEKDDEKRQLEQELVSRVAMREITGLEEENASLQEQVTALAQQLEKAMQQVNDGQERLLDLEKENTRLNDEAVAHEKVARMPRTAGPGTASSPTLSQSHTPMVPSPVPVNSSGRLSVGSLRSAGTVSSHSGPPQPASTQATQSIPQFGKSGSQQAIAVPVQSTIPPAASPLRPLDPARIQVPVQVGGFDNTGGSLDSTKEALRQGQGPYGTGSAGFGSSASIETSPLRAASPIQRGRDALVAPVTYQAPWQPGQPGLQAPQLQANGDGVLTRDEFQAAAASARGSAAALPRSSPVVLQSPIGMTESSVSSGRAKVYAAATAVQAMPGGIPPQVITRR
eukprot:TRINITY_DN29996_c0_g1_i2.p1 TRINITY_DN29996_c0_g1~~TRINITY_DN29996_c0_g1_i2.p1  ORF type:complete len:1305 (-),score=357.71 TRINITY_DN29996_c0_g1_i2:106-3987(-)